ncbi:MAG: glycosyltransferase family 4 protein [Planctomycetes bacterium]|nr:glycosyltransferase family 4 protein [Planctomycetota bacterium]
MRALLFPGHFVQYSIELANGLVEAGAEVGLATHPDSAEKLVGPRWRELLDERVQFLAMPGAPVRKPWTRSYLLNRGWLKRTIRSFTPDVIHLQDGNDLATLLMAWRTRIPVTVTIHDVVAHPGDEKNMSWRMDFLINKILMPRARKRNTQFVLHGKSLRSDFLRDWKTTEDCVHVVPHGILAGFVQPGESLEGVGVGDPPGPALFFGRMLPYKGLEVFAAALPKVVAALPQARFLVAGRGPSLDRARDQLSKFEQVEIRDKYIQSKEVAELYRRACVNLAPYIEASQSGVIAAGYAFGVPSIASRVGAIPEVVVHEENGLLVKPGDADSLAEALIRYFNDSNLRAQLQNSVRAWASGPLAWSSVARKTLEVYARACRKA